MTSLDWKAFADDAGCHLTGMLVMFGILLWLGAVRTNDAIWFVPFAIVCSVVWGLFMRAVRARRRRRYG